MLLSIVGIVVACFLIWWFCGQFEKASLYLGRHLNAGVRGATINAVGSSLPELFTALFSIFLFNQKDGIVFGIGTTAGSAVFNVVVIPLMVLLVFFVTHRSRGISLNKKVFLRDGLFLLFSEILLLTGLFSGTISIGFALLLLGFYVLYAVVLFCQGRKSRVQDDEPHDYCVVGRVPALLKLDFVSLFLRNCKGRLTDGKAWWILVFSLLFIGLSCHLLVEMCYIFSDEIGLSPYLTALLFAAGATSLPDTILSIKDAQRGNSEDALSNSFGSNVFDICIGIGLPFFLWTLFNGSIELTSNEIFSVITLEIFLIFLTVLLLLFFVIPEKVRRWQVFFLITLFVLFVLFLLGQVANAEWYKMLFSYVI